MPQYIASLDPSRRPGSIPGAFNVDEDEHLASVSADGADASVQAMAADPPVLVDLRSLEHVTPIDENLICSVCHCAFIHPVILPQCEHIFCAECYDSACQHRKNTCPLCRCKSESKLRAAPRALSNMVEDLKVKCPSWAEGCEEIIRRGEVQAHVDKYCAYTEVKCPGENCHSMVLRKDFKDTCQHKLVACEDCHELIVAKDLKDHRQTECLNRWLSCSACSREILHCKSDVHESEDCPEQTARCTGSPLGCPFTSRRAVLSTHTATCPFALLQPFISSQNERIQTLEDENKLMRRKWDSFGVGDLSDQMAAEAAEPRRRRRPSDPRISATAPNSPTHEHESSPPFDSAIHHLLSSYENLRHDLDRLGNQLSELDARQSMMQMNESLRIKEDFSHVNAVIGGMRVQLHWLMSRGLQGQAQNRVQAVAGPSSAVGTGSNRSVAGTGDEGRTVGTGPRPSDTLRQDTKL